MTIPDSLPHDPDEVIKWIRKEKFGQPDNPLANDLQRSVQQLATDLYSDDSHFILELIQNAEDNRYDENCSPALTFRLLENDPTHTDGSAQALLVSNNETGLRREDVSALCSVGATTKNKTDGYIGEKGIGFKSVFKVSRRPHLFSGGYRFCFDREPDPDTGLGFIVPHEVSTIPAELSPDAETAILLPLDAGKEESIASELQNIAPETILFLTRLRSLNILLPGADPVQISAEPGEGPIVELNKNGSKSRYWVTHYEVARPENLQEEKRDARIVNRTLSIAFPLSDTNRNTGHPVFVWLPAKARPGYPFLINADFLLTASREDLLTDRPWNQWLRNEIAPSFLKSFCALLSSELEERYGAYRFIPLPDEARDEFFRKPVGEILDTLRKKAIIWTIQGTLSLPEHTCLIDDELRNLLERCDSLPRCLQKTVPVHHKLMQFRQKTVLSELGVKELDKWYFRECLTGDTTWMEGQPADWYRDLFAYLKEFVKPDSEMTIVPAENGRRLGCPRKVFWPAQDIVAQSDQPWFAEIQPQYLDSHLSRLLEEEPELLKWVRTHLAPEWSPEGHLKVMLDAFNQQFGQLSPQEVADRTRPIRDLVNWLAEKKPGWSLEADSLSLRLQNGTNARAPGAGFVTPLNLDPDTGWHQVFPEPADQEMFRVVSDCYLENCSDPDERKAWRIFFRNAKIHEFRLPKQVWNFRYHYIGNLPKPVQDNLEPVIKNQRGNGTYTDFLVPGWLQQLGQGNQLPDAVVRKRSHVLLATLEKVHKEREIVTTLIKNETPQEAPESIFLALLRRAAWVPTDKGLYPPGQVFVDKPAVRELLGNAVPCLDVPISDSLATKLGIHTEVTTGSILAVLQFLSEKPGTTADKTMVESLYHELDRRSAGSDWHTGFKDRRLIFVPEHPPRWVSVEDVVCEDKTGELSRLVSLKKYYPRLLPFFEKAGVRAEPPLEAYFRRWLELQQSDSSPETVENSLKKLMPRLDQLAQKKDAAEWEEFVPKARVWSKERQFASPSDLYAADLPEIAFEMEKQGISFAWQPVGHDCINLFRALGVPLLSASVRYSDWQHAPAVPAEAAQHLLTEKYRQNICARLWKYDKKLYRTLCENGTLQTMLTLREAHIEGDIRRSCLLKTVSVSESPKAYISSDKRILYVSCPRPEDRMEAEKAIVREVASLNPENADHLQDVMDLVIGGRPGYLEVKPLPEEEQGWIEARLDDWRSRLAQPELENAYQTEAGEAEVGESPFAPQAVETVLPDPISESEPESDWLPPSGTNTGDREQLSSSDKLPPAPHQDQPHFLPPERAESRPRSRSGESRDNGKTAQAFFTDEMTRPSGIDPEKRKEIEVAAIALAMRWEEWQGRKVEDKNQTTPNHEGYDLVSRDGETERYIEVKGTAEEWSEWGVALSARQYQEALEKGERYYLYVVENALDSAEHRLYIFCDPAAKMATLRIGRDWKTVADTTATCSGESGDLVELCRKQA